MKTAQEAPAPSNAFLQVMQTHDGGEICNELAEAMREATQAVLDAVREKVKVPLLIGS